MSRSVTRAIDMGLAGCHTCGLVMRSGRGHQKCPRCGCGLHLRKPNSIHRAWALLISAVALYFPANIMPVMHTRYLGGESADTILSGVIYFLKHGDWPLALVIFVASVVVPVLKMIALAYLLITVQRSSLIRQRERTVLYRFTELIGRWSMVDVFVVAVLGALVQLDVLATIVPGTGAVCFAAVVILTMLAAMAFDPRLIWDQQERLAHAG